MIPRIVIDTNVYVSRFINPNSLPGQAVKRAWSEATTLVSTATMFELRSVLKREKLARYVDQRELEPYLQSVLAIAEHIVPHSNIQACRHAHDDKFLELAVDGRADLILTGDHDLLALNPFRGIPIITPTQYLARS